MPLRLGSVAVALLVVLAIGLALTLPPSPKFSAMISEPRSKIRFAPPLCRAASNFRSFLRRFVAAALLLAVLVHPAIARAGANESVAWILTRVGDWGHPLRASTTVLGYLAFFYLLNLVFIARPAARATDGRVSSAWLTLAGYTLLTQVLDRVSVLAALAVGTLLPGWLGIESEFSLLLAVVAGITTNFTLSGLIVFFASRRLMRHHWKTDPATARSIALRAAFFTNPAWGIGLSVLY